MPVLRRGYAAGEPDRPVSRFRHYGPPESLGGKRQSASRERRLAKRPETVSDPARMSSLHLSFSILGLAAVAAGAADFKKDIRPILKAKCYECHNAGMKQPKAGYVFDDLTKLANDIGPKGQIVPGDPERSNLLDLVTRDKDRMPPGNKEGLTPKEVKLLREWIEEGASLDGSTAAAKSGGSGLAPRTSDPPPAPLQDWTSAEGKTIKARYVRMSGEAVIIRTAENKSFKVPLTKLNAASQEQAKASAAADQ